MKSVYKLQFERRFFFTLETAVDVSRKVCRLQFPSQTNVFSAPLNSSFHAQFHVSRSFRSRKEEENVFVDCKSRVFNIREEKGEAYRISIELRSLQLIGSDRVPNGTSFRGRHSFIHSFKDEKRFSTLIHLEIKRHLI